MYRVLLITGSLCAAASLGVSGQQPARSVSSPISPRAAAPRTTPAGSTRSAIAARSAPAPRSADPRILPGTRDSAFTTIKGNALNSTGGGMPNAAVRLRNARSGRIVDTQLADDTGMFTFRAVDPGSYIVEIVGTDQTILAASQLLSVNAGDALSAVVKLPFRIPPFAGFLGHTASSATAVAGAAASAEVLAAAATKDSSPE